MMRNFNTTKKFLCPSKDVHSRFATAMHSGKMYIRHLFRYCQFICTINILNKGFLLIFYFLTPSLSGREQAYKIWLYIIAWFEFKLKTRFSKYLITGTLHGPQGIGIDCFSSWFVVHVDVRSVDCKRIFNTYVCLE